ncbi:uncharacterized protein LOC117110898 [Anneissia japonica]|uniref:uncharacterized protein LOC117110898 n=1 Tax=Anneissia japonica TaxID=1529436 RepID=UPI0014259974|nr:uncharacterized protein LOC117110898 [Anneissia japonica]
MDTVLKSVVMCLLLACVYGAPADTKGKPVVKVEKTFDVEGRTLTETMEQTDDGIIIDVEAQQGSSALTVFTDLTHGLLIHRHKSDDSCYISSLADYNDTALAQENPKSVFKYRLEPISEINRQYFRYTATDSMKRICSGAGNILWSVIHADAENETRQKRHECTYKCSTWCFIICNTKCELTC